MDNPAGRHVDRVYLFYGAPTAIFVLGFLVKRPFLPVIITIAAACWAAALTFVLLDPFDVYPWGARVTLKSGGDYSMQSTPYLVDVVARTSSIDTLFLGTSTGHLYTKKMLEEILPNTHRAFNLSYSNPSSPDRTAVARELLRHSHAQRFIIETDWTYMVPKAEQRAAPSFPLYLYDMVWWNDVRGINWQALQLSLAVLRGEPLWIPAWSQAAELEGYRRRYDLLHSSSAIAEFTGYVSQNKRSIDTPSKLSCGTMNALNEDLVPFVNALSTRGAEVDILMPVYAWILYYWTVDADGRGLSRRSLLNDQLKLRSCVVEALDGLPGVRIFAFDDVPGLAADIRNYFDPVHMYNPAANRYVLQSIVKGEHRLTRENIDAKNSQMRAAVAEYRLTNDKVWAAPPE
jgi:hypothetical protein